MNCSLEIPSGKEHRQCCQCQSPYPPLLRRRRRRRYGNVGKGVDRLARITDGFHRWCECRCDYRQLSFAIRTKIIRENSTMHPSPPLLPLTSLPRYVRINHDGLLSLYIFLYLCFFFFYI